MSADGGQSARDIVREGAQEVREKLKEDLSRWTRFRRFVSLSPEISCIECDGAGKLQCTACRGTGKLALVREDGTQEPCPKCGEFGSITCTACAGKGRIRNPHRKRLLWILGLGGVAWLLILFQLWGRDILPAQRAAILQRGEHGKSITTPPAPGTHGSGVPAPGSGAATPAGRVGTSVPMASPMPGQPGGVAAPARNAPYPPGAPPVAPRSGGAHGNSVVAPPYQGQVPGASGYAPAPQVGPPAGPRSGGWPIGGGKSLGSGAGSGY